MKLPIRKAGPIGGLLLASMLGVAPANAHTPTDDPTDAPSSSTVWADVSGNTVVVGNQVSVGLDDTPNTTSPATERAVQTTYDEADLRCVFRVDVAHDVVVEHPDQLEEAGCVADDTPTVAQIQAAMARELQTVRIAAPPISYQPDGDWALINVDFIVYTQADTQLLHTTVLGAGVTIRATAVHYAWDFGDGSPPLSTTQPGQPYPDQTVAHVYTSAADAVVVTLTTTWQGEFQVDGGDTWYPITGFATTTSTSPTVEIVAMDVHLVPNP